MNYTVFEMERKKTVRMGTFNSHCQNVAWGGKEFSFCEKDHTVNRKVNKGKPLRGKADWSTNNQEQSRVVIFPEP